MSDTATIEHELGDPPANRDEYCYMASAGGWTGGSNSIHEAIRQAWDLSRNVESTVTVWDYRGDGTDYDPDATPRAIFAVGCAYIGE